MFDGSWLTVSVGVESETPVKRHLAQDYPDFSELPDVHGGSSGSYRSGAEAAQMLPVGPALAVIVLLSIGLWTAIWVATSSFFSP